MSHAEFTVAYDGPALRGHTMDVRTLAPALLGFGELFDAANRTLNGNDAQVRVHVRALETGCFQISFDIVISLAKQVAAFLSSSEVTAAVNLKELIGFATGREVSLLELLRMAAGRKPEKVTPLAHGVVRIQFGSDTADVPVSLLRLFQDLGVREAVQKVVREPLQQEGVETFEVRENCKPIFVIEQAEAKHFAQPPVEDEVLIEEVRKSAFFILSLAFKENNKWRLDDGTAPINATIEDEDFLRRVDANAVSFTKGDILICEVRVIQRRTDAGLKTEHTVTRVIEHRPGARQLQLPL